MNAFRKTRMLALLALVAMIFVGMSVSSAEAGCHSLGYGGYHTSYYAPIQYVSQAYTYPVTLFDCYGQPYTILKTGFRSVPLNILP